MKLSRWVLLFIAFFGAASSAGQSRKLEAVSPGQLFEGSHVSVRAPNSEGWLLLASSSTATAFAKTSRRPGETLSAQVVMFELEPADTPAEFLALIRSGIEKDTNPSRFNVIRSESEYTADRAYPCVRHRGALEDKEARTSPNAKETLLLEVEALYCRHPVRSNMGFAAIYSHRGRTPYPALGDEARDFIQGIQVP